MPTSQRTCSVAEKGVAMEKKLLPIAAQLSEAFEFDRVFMISALNGSGCADERYVRETLEPLVGPVMGDTLVHLIGVGLDAATRCRFEGVGIVEASQAARDGDGGVLCLTPAAMTSRDAPLALSVDGIDWVDAIEPLTSSRLGFIYHAPPTVASLTPASGPAGGATRIRVGAAAPLLPPMSTALEPRSAQRARCTVEGHTVNASYADGGAQLRIVSPVAAGAAQAARAAEVRCTLNGQQFGEGGSRASLFYYYADGDGANTSSQLTIQPMSGPVGGGTRVELGVFARHPPPEALSPRCLFDGDRVVEASIVAAEGVEHAHGAYGENTTSETFLLACTSPAIAQNASETATERFSARLRFSLNAQQYSDGTTVGFYYPRPRAEQLTPSRGLISGGTLIEIRGGSLGGGNGVRSCDFGGSAVEATLVSGADGSAALRCAAPSAHTIGLSETILPSFVSDEALSSTASLLGGARLRAPLTVELTSGLEAGMRGALVLHRFGGRPPLDDFEACPSPMRFCPYLSHSSSSGLSPYSSLIFFSDSSF